MNNCKTVQLTYFLSTNESNLKPEVNICSWPLDGVSVLLLNLRAKQQKISNFNNYHKIATLKKTISKRKGVTCLTSNLVTKVLK